MLKEPGLSSLTALFGSTQDKSQEDSEKLLDLYWNRAELKKEFAGVQKEQFKLQDKIKQQEGVAARVQQQLDHLEELLVDPDWAHNVVVFYQMRGLALRCQQKLATFAEQLKQQREQKQHNRVLVAWNDERTRDQLQAERRRLTSMSGFLKFFKRRSVNAFLNSISDQIAVAQEEEDGLLLAIEEIQNRTPPDTEGLDAPSKRSINLMIVAFAQQLYLTFADGDLAAMAKESSEKSVGAINYGTHEDCEQVMEKIREVTKWMDQASDFAETLQQRSKMLCEKAVFRNDSDVVPASGTVATLFDIDPNGLVRESDLNVLGENWWGISKILSR
jgi:hypothetical protein